jgi:hypothetical protein
MKEDIPKDGEHKLEVPATRPPAMFVADDPGLDFLNSIGTPAGTVIEWLANGEDLLAWLEQAKLIDSAAAAAIRANSFPGELDEVAAQACALREWFRKLVLTHMGRPLTAKALDLLEPLNRVLERDEQYRAIVAGPGHPRHQPREVGARVALSTTMEYAKFPASPPRTSNGRSRLLPGFFPRERVPGQSVCAFISR